MKQTAAMGKLSGMSQMRRVEIHVKQLAHRMLFCMALFHVKRRNRFAFKQERRRKGADRRVSYGRQV